MTRKTGILLAISIAVLGSALNLLVPYSSYSAPDKEHSSIDLNAGQFDVAFKYAEGYVPVWKYEVTKQTVWERVLLQEVGILVAVGVLLAWSRKSRLAGAAPTTG